MSVFTAEMYVRPVSQSKDSIAVKIFYFNRNFWYGPSLDKFGIFRLLFAVVWHICGHDLTPNSCRMSSSWHSLGQGVDMIHITHIFAMLALMEKHYKYLLLVLQTFWLMLRWFSCTLKHLDIYHIKVWMQKRFTPMSQRNIQHKKSDCFLLIIRRI